MILNMQTNIAKTAIMQFTLKECVQNFLSKLLQASQFDNKKSYLNTQA